MTDTPAEAKLDVNAVTGLPTAPPRADRTTLRRTFGEQVQFNSKGMTEAHARFVQHAIGHQASESKYATEAALLQHMFNPTHAEEVHEELRGLEKKLEAKRAQLKRAQDRQSKLTDAPSQSQEQNLTTRIPQLQEVIDQLERDYDNHQILAKHSFAYALLRLQAYKGSQQTHASQLSMYRTAQEEARKSNPGRIGYLEGLETEVLGAMKLLRLERKEHQDQLVNLIGIANDLMAAPKPSDGLTSDPQAGLRDAIGMNLLLLWYMGNVKSEREGYDPRVAAGIAMKTAELLSSDIEIPINRRVAIALEELPSELLDAYTTWLDTKDEFKKLLPEYQSAIRARREVEEQYVGTLGVARARDILRPLKEKEVSTRRLIEMLSVKVPEECRLYEQDPNKVDGVVEKLLEKRVSAAATLALSAYAYAVEAQDEVALQRADAVLERLVGHPRKDEYGSPGVEANAYVEDRERIRDLATRTCERGDVARPENCNLFDKIDLMTDNPHVKDLYMRDVEEVAMNYGRFQLAFFAAAARVRIVRERVRDVKEYVNAVTVSLGKSSKDAVYKSQRASRLSLMLKSSRDEFAGTFYNAADALVRLRNLHGVKPPEQYKIESWQEFSKIARLDKKDWMFIWTYSNKK